MGEGEIRDVVVEGKNIRGWTPAEGFKEGVGAGGEYFLCYLRKIMCHLVG